MLQSNEVWICEIIISYCASKKRKENYPFFLLNIKYSLPLIQSRLNNKKITKLVVSYNKRCSFMITKHWLESMAVGNVRQNPTINLVFLIPQPDKS